MSCTSATSCTAVGYRTTGGQRFALHAAERDGVWAAAVQYAATSFEGQSGLGSEFFGVSCIDANDCTAVGADNMLQSFWFLPGVAVERDDMWGGIAQLSDAAPPPIELVTGVSCTSAVTCTAVGFGAGSGVEGPLLETESGGTWGPTGSLNCSGSVCDVSSTYLSAVSCTSASECTAVGGGDAGPIYATETGGTWGALTVLPTSVPFGPSGISCTSAGNCTAVGAGGNPEQPTYATETNGVWGAGAVLAVPGGTGSFSAVSCTSTLDCTAVGSNGQPIYATETNGRWGSVTEVASPIPGGVLSGVSCASAADCTAVGSDALGYALFPTETAGVWPTVPAAPRIGRVTPGKRSIRVSWAAPRGGARVGAYAVSAVRGKHSYSCETALTSCVLGGLTNGESYTVWVNARDAAGSSADSTKSKATPHE